MLQFFSFWDKFIYDNLVTHFYLVMLPDGRKEVELEGVQLSQWVNACYWINFIYSLEVAFSFRNVYLIEYKNEWPLTEFF